MSKKAVLFIFFSTLASTSAYAEPFGIRDHSAFTQGGDSCLVQNPVAAPRREAFVPIDLPSKTKREAEARAGRNRGSALHTDANVPQQPLGALFGN